MGNKLFIRQVYDSDLLLIANIHILSYPSSALTLLGTEATSRYYEWQLNGPHPHVVALGREYEGLLVGFGGRFKYAMMGYLQNNWGFLYWRFITHPWPLGDRKQLS